MKAVRQLLYWLHSRREETALREELEFHRAEVQRRLEARGIDPSHAARESRRAMGNVTLAREDARDTWAVRAIDVLWRDIRCGARTLRREPTFALTAILTLAIGAATTTTVFSVVDAELWKPLPFDHPEQLVAVYSSVAEHAVQDSLSGADFQDWAAGAPAIAQLAGYAGSRRSALQRDVAESVRVDEVTWNLLETLGRRPVAGRTFMREDARTGAAILTDRAWRRLFSADPSIVGSSLLLDGRTVRVVGIVPAVDVDGPESDVLVPIDDTTAGFHDRAGQVMTSIIGRLRPGASVAEAQAQLQAVANRIARDYPDGRVGHVVHVTEYREFYGRNDRRPLYFFLAASVFVLMLTCVNVAGLLLARALKRRSEFAIRGALGGGMAALLRQLVIEGFCLALPASAAALLLTGWAVRVFATEVPPDYLWRETSLAVDWRVGGLALAISILTAAVFGLAPAVAARRIDLGAALGDGARTAGATPAESRIRTTLLAAQIALTLVLLAAGGLFLKSYAALMHVPLGFDPAGGVSFRVSLTGARYRTDRQIIGYADALRQRALAIPGIEHAVVASTSPLTSGALIQFSTGQKMASPDREPLRAIIRAVTPSYFSMLRIRLLQGREFNSFDTATSPRVAVINEVLAERYFHGENPVGRTLTILPGQHSPWTRKPGEVTIVGVSAKAKQVGINEIDFPDIAVPFVQLPAPSMELIARTRLPSSIVSAPIRAAAAQLDPQIPLGRVTPLDARIDDALREDRFHLLLMASFAIVALLLAGMGIYGAVAYAAEQRQREFGIRLALGATGAGVVVLAIRSALRIAIAGAAVGLAAAVALGKFIGTALYLVPGVHNGLLFGVRTSDPLVLASAVVALIVVTLVASAIPARRVAWIDPVASLRQ